MLDLLFCLGIVNDDNAEKGKTTGNSTAVQGDLFGRGKAFVDIVVVGSQCSDDQLGCWAATATSGTYNKMLNKTFSTTTRVTR